MSSSTVPALAPSVSHWVPVARPLGTIASLAVADVCALLFAIALSAWGRRMVLGGSTASIPALTVSCVLFTVCSFIAARLYPGMCENPAEELRRVFIATTLAFLCLGASTFLSHDLSQSRFVVLLAWALSVALVPLCRALVRSLFANQPWWGCPVVIMGLGETGRRVLSTLQAHPRFGLKPVAVLDDHPHSWQDLDPDLVTGPLSSCAEITRRHRISYGIVCIQGGSRAELLDVMARYGHCFSHVMVIPDLIGMASLGLEVREVGGVIGLEITQKLLQPWPRRVKRALDLAIGIPVALLALPIVTLAAVLIKLESPGPVFYRNERIGFRGRAFGAWKLRSMVVNGDEVLRRYLADHPEERFIWERTQKLRRDPRVTRIGRFIRMTSIDELPQLWNVLRGEMSMVGPRPFLENQVERYGPTFELYKRVRPGITGLWQISGRNRLTFEDRVRLDAYHIQNWSVWLDLYILARTATAVLTAKGAY